jgi:hypothetical protein
MKMGFVAKRSGAVSTARSSYWECCLSCDWRDFNRLPSYRREYARPLPLARANV